MSTQPNLETASPARGRGNDRRPIAAMTPGRYEIVADEEVADQARAMLATMSGAV
jgi:hypothetical protein